MGAPKCVPSFEQRPGFPSGLRVLLVDGDAAARDRTEQQLRECSYEVTACASSAEAVVQISSAAAPFDVLLADKAAIGAIPATTSTPSSGPAPMRSGLLDSCKGVPCILMGSDPTPADVMLGVSLGAVDFLAKPLSQLKLRNIWQHTVRKMMSDMQISSKGLDRSGSSAMPGAPQRQQAEAPAKAAAALPPRSPDGGARSPLLHARCAMHTCISSTNLAGGEPERAEERQAPAAAAAADDKLAPAAAPSAPKACCSPPPQSASGATATATATHASMPLQSYGVPVPGTLGALPPGQCWGMPMPVVRAPGIVPPKAPAAAAPPQHAAAPWGYMGCGYMPHPSYMMMPPGNMYAPSPMAPPPGYGCYPGAPMPGPCYPPYPGAAPPAAPRQPQQPHVSAADAAKALDADLASLCDLDVDLDDVLQDLAAPDCDAPAPAPLHAALHAKSPATADDSCMGSGSTDCGEDVGAVAPQCALLRSSSGAVSSRGSMESCREALPRGLCGGGDAVGALCGGVDGLTGDDEDDWGEMEADGLAALRRSGSLADLFAEPMAVVA